jgi:hypothetical protein
MSRQMDDLCRIKSVTQEAQRLGFHRCFLDETVRGITQFVHSLPSDLVFDLGEVGISEWEDRTSKNVIVPKAMSSQTLQQKGNRNLKHVSIIAELCAASKSLIPYLVISQDPL